ncbi:hypothetical protein GCM10023214_03820 [Amycolatopsis dongchuanensis]|uniref:Uncharacterized protein n=1 Tax=Amycolatopsis dongchuanensis TaxID=1070866 RepID=A0ABP9PY84_9PSEU
MTVVARRTDRLDALVGKTAATGGQALAGRADITDEEQAHGLGDIRRTLINPDPADKAEVYHPGKRTVRAETNLDPHSWGYGKCPRGN